MGAKAAATSKCREKIKEPILAKEPKEIPPPHMPLYLSLPLTPSSAPPPLTLDKTVTPVKSGLEDLGPQLPQPL
jgi:hypothetical protein